VEADGNVQFLFSDLIVFGTLRPDTWVDLGSGHSNIVENQEKKPKSTSISTLIDQFSCKNWLIKDGGC